MSVTSSSLGTVWRAGNHQMIMEGEEVNLSKICTSLNRYLDNISYPSSKVPLRVSSVLINGAAKLYSAGVSDLLQECYKLDMEIVTRKTRMVKLDTGCNKDANILNATNNNEKHSQTSRINDTISSLRKRRRTISNNFLNEKRSRSASSIDSPEELDHSIEDDQQNCTDHGNGSDDVLSGFNLRMPQDNRETHEKGVQTNQSYLNSRHSTNSHNGSFDKNLPFGFVMIYDSFNDRMPSKIIFSSFHSDVKEL